MFIDIVDKIAYMSLLSDRIKLALDEAGLDQSALSRIVGVSTVAVNGWCTGSTKTIKGENLLKAAAALKVTPEWLSSGRGSMRTSEKKAEATYPREPSEDDYALIPQYSTKGACGSGALNDHVEVVGGLAFKRDWLKRFGLKESNACVIYATGSSMNPTLEDGDVVLLDCSAKELQNGKVYAICIDNEVRIKRVHVSFGKITLVSDNSDKLRYPDEEVPPEVQLDVIGRGVWQGGRL